MLFLWKSRKSLLSKLAFHKQALVAVIQAGDLAELLSQEFARITVWTPQRGS
jgi:hypothetical protein